MTDEILILSKIAKLIEPLPQAAKERILTYLQEVFHKAPRIEAK